MADTTTTNLLLTKPEVGSSSDTWGGKNNNNFDKIDGEFTTISAIAVLKLSAGGTQASTAAAARTNLGLGTISTQDASAAHITGGDVSGVSYVTSSGPITALATGFVFPDGTTLATAPTPAGGATWQTKTTNFGTANGGAYYVTSAVTVTLHTGAANDTVRIVSGLAVGGGNITVNPAGGQTVMGDTTLVIDRAYSALSLALIGTDWRIV